MQSTSEFAVVVNEITSMFNCPSEEKLSLLIEELYRNLVVIDEKQEELVQKLLALDWSGIKSEWIDNISQLLLNLVSIHVCHLEAILTSLVKRLIPKRKINNADNMDTLSSEEMVFEKAKNLLLAILTLIPLSSKKIPRVVAQCFPYVKRPEEEIIVYVRNLLDLCRSYPKIRDDLLEIIVEEMTLIDVHASRDDILSEQMPEKEDVFAMDIDDIGVSTSDETNCLSVEACRTTHAMGRRLDHCMEEVFEYMRECCFIEQDVLDNSSAKKMYKSLLRIFQSKILPVYACSHSQFIIFFLCSLQKDFVYAFLGMLWSKFLDPDVPQVIRQSCSCYMASFIARANFVSKEDALAYINEWIKWIHAYIDTQDSSRCQSRNVHGTFYSLCQAVMYLIVYRQRELTASDEDVQFLQNLNLERIVKCRLNPLRFCLVHVVNNFASVARNYQLAYCYSIIDRNARHDVYSREQDILEKDPLEAFFPFDRYVLKRSDRFIVGLYRHYNGINEAGLTGSNSAEDLLLQYSTTRNGDHTDPKDLSFYGASPGFSGCL